MLTALTLSGFKAFGAPQRIEFKPITLLFGPNSGGKSSILHALHYARELLLRGNADAEFTESGGEQVELGGFQTFAHHGGSGEKSVRLQFEMDLTEDDLPVVTEGMSPFSALTHLVVLDRISERVQHAAVGITVAPLAQGGAQVVEFSLDINGQHLGTLHAHPTDGQASPCALELRDHPIFKDLDGPDDRDDQWPNLIFKLFTEAGEEATTSRKVHLLLPPRSSAIPTLGRVLPIHFQSGESGGDSIKESSRDQLVLMSSRLFVGVGQLLFNALEPFRYIGPIRKVPERSHAARIPIGLSRWADGTAAWEAMEQSPRLLEEVSNWLSNEDKLGTKYSLVREEQWQIEPSELHASRLRAAVQEQGLSSAVASTPSVRRRGRVLLSDEQARTHHPRDVGIGYSQVIPVMAACLDFSPTASKLVAMEQPELHIHPRLQVRLGNLLVHAATHPDRPKCLLIETHSEHLILRLLRCIRETANGRSSPSALPPLTKEKIGVYFVNPNAMGASEIVKIRVDDEGEFVDRWPGGFFEDRGVELFGEESC